MISHNITGRSNTNFNPRPRAGGDCRSYPAQSRASPISIHAPRAGGDSGLGVSISSSFSFQSTPPVWGATWRRWKNCPFTIFQSTPPVWGATHGRRRQPCRGAISIHAPRVGGDIGAEPLALSDCISIHAPRVGGDFLFIATIPDDLFQSTPPVWGATRTRTVRIKPAINFNPRPPCGGRPFGFQFLNLIL